jgi:hypothetical protein
VLLDDLPEASRFKEATERTFRVVEYQGDDEELPKGTLLKLQAIGPPPKDVEVIAEYVDWTHERKLLARNALETACARADGRNYQPDVEGLIEPLTAILLEREQRARSEFQERGQTHILSGLFGFGRR